MNDDCGKPCPEWFPKAVDTYMRGRLVELRTLRHRTGIEKKPMAFPAVCSTRPSTVGSDGLDVMVADAVELGEEGNLAHKLAAVREKTVEQFRGGLGEALGGKAFCIVIVLAEGFLRRAEGSCATLAAQAACAASMADGAEPQGEHVVLMSVITPWGDALGWAPSAGGEIGTRLLREDGIAASEGNRLMSAEEAAAVLGARRHREGGRP